MTAVTIKGVIFEVPDDPSIVVGAPMTEGQVNALAQTRRENVRNNFAAHVEKALNGNTDLESDAHAELQRKLDEYVAQYQFGVRQPGTGRRATDPVEKEMIRIAKEDITAAFFAKTGEKIKGEALSELVDRLLEAKGEDYNRRARSAIREREAAAEAVLSGLAAAA